MFNSKKQVAEIKRITESFAADIALQLEGKDWQSLGYKFEDLTTKTRVEIIKRSMQAYREFPAYRRVINLNKAFVLGKGIKRPVVENPGLQFVIDCLWDNPENLKTFTGYIAAKNQLAIKDMQGELFYKIYVNTITGKSVIRVEKQTTRVLEVITKEEDTDFVVGYEYETVKIVRNGDNKEKKTKKIKIPHASVESLNDLDRIKRDYPDAVVEETVMFGLLIAFGNESYLEDNNRGLPVYNQIFPWLKAHRDMAAEAATFIKALTRFAWKKKFKGNMDKDKLEGLAKLANTFTSQANSIQKLPTSTGATLYETDAVDNQPIEVKQNPSVFYETARVLMLQIASGSDKMEHYFGNPSNANLATATSMELPMIKDFESQQQEFAEVFGIVTSFVVAAYLKSNSADAIFKRVDEKGYRYNKEMSEQYKKEIEQMTVGYTDVQPFIPQILGRVVESYILAVIAAYNSGLLTDKDATYLVYTVLEFQNVDDKLSEIFGDDYKGILTAGDGNESSEDKIKALAEKIKSEQEQKVKNDQETENAQKNKNA